MGKPSRDKGKRGERQACVELNRLFNCNARRSQQFSGADHTADIKSDIIGCHFEVKRQETMKMYPWLKQASEDAAATDCPVVLHRQNGKPWIACLYLDDVPGLVTLVNEYMEQADD
jgi:hypothetical protein